MNKSQTDPSRRFASALAIVARIVAAIFFVGAGANHFRHPEFYQSIVPPHLGSPAVLVVVSGVCEIAGGIGLMIGPLRRASGRGLIALLIAVFPANIYMALLPDRIPDLHLSRWLLWARLPLQVVLIAWVWVVSASSKVNSEKLGSVTRVDT